MVGYVCAFVAASVVGWTFGEWLCWAARQQRVADCIEADEKFCRAIEAVTRSRCIGEKT